MPATQSHALVEQYRRATDRGRIAQRGIGIVAIATLLLAIATVNELRLLTQTQDGRLITIDEANSSDLFVGITAIVFIASWVFAVIAWCRWIYSAHQAVAQSTSEGLAFSPRSAVLWYFVPLANLVIPYRVMAEIWRASNLEGVTRGQEWKRRPVPSHLRWWWGSFLIMNWGATISFRLNASSMDLDAYIASDYVSLFSDVLTLLGCAFAYGLIRTVNERQGAG